MKERAIARKGQSADGSSYSPSLRTVQTNVRLETGRSRTSRNGAVAFTLIVFALACGTVLAAWLPVPSAWRPW